MPATWKTNTDNVLEQYYDLVMSARIRCNRHATITHKRKSRAETHPYRLRSLVTCRPSARASGWPAAWPRAARRPGRAPASRCRTWRTCTRCRCLRHAPSARSGVHSPPSSSGSQSWWRTSRRGRLQWRAHMYIGRWRRQAHDPQRTPPTEAT